MDRLTHIRIDNSNVCETTVWAAAYAAILAKAGMTAEYATACADRAVTIYRERTRV